MARRHARKLGTFLFLGVVLLCAGTFPLHEDLSLGGSALALLALAALLAVVTTCGVTVSAVCNSTLLGVALLYVLLYGGYFALALLPRHFPTPRRALEYLPNILRGHYDLGMLLRFVGWSGLACLLVSAVGLVHFARRDV